MPSFRSSAGIPGSPQTTVSVETSLREDNLLEADVNHAVHAVFRLLDRKITAGEIADIKNVLPEDIRKLWPRAATA